MSDHNKDYEVGYGKPPRASRFKPGRSGNPSGRPKGRVNLMTDLLDELAEQIPIRERDRQTKVTKQRAVIKSLVARSLQGETRAAALLIGLLTKIGEPAAPADASAPTQRTSAADQAIIDAFLHRQAKAAPQTSEPKEPSNVD